MSRLSIVTKSRSQETVEELYKDVERRIQASQPGLCPVDLAKSSTSATVSPAGNAHPAGSVWDSWRI